jgi:hypothetical protein
VPSTDIQCLFTHMSLVTIRQFMGEERCLDITSEGHPNHKNLQTLKYAKQHGIVMSL